MVIAVFGESCTGKSTIAKLLQQQFSADDACRQILQALPHR
ncbi:MAG: hypothetical protein ACOYJR_02945 [Acutalibacteraceae bacterium]